MNRTDHRDIRIGTLAPMELGTDYLRDLVPLGFESFELNNWMYIPEGLDLEDYAKRVLEVLGDEAVVSSLGVYGNPLQDERNRGDWERLIRAARAFGASVVCGFAGAVEDRPVDENMDRFREVWQPLAQLAEDEGVRIGFENCAMGGTWNRPAWNIAHSPRAWEMMFNAVPSPALGLEWEPAHQLTSFADPIGNLRDWVGKVVHVHGKDATVAWDRVRRYGLHSGVQVAYDRTPGFGDTNWTDVISILREGKFQGAIDIEGWHDPIYREDLEMTGQVHALNYLKACRGGVFVPNPSTGSV
jgi:sugar phosphate isomerase/epimerase